MLFNSIEFAIFLPIVFWLYWFVFKWSKKAQNILLLIASYIFYGWWDWKFLSLIIFSSLVDFSIGKSLAKQKNTSIRKGLLWTSLVINLGLLAVFKYYNFFVENFVSAFSLMGKELSIETLNIILPVGISFYTFQTLSYTIDVYKGNLKPTNDIVSFLTFVSFFPQLVAGPIERASSLLPQFYEKREFDYQKSVDGVRQILWGLFKKIVVADSCAQYVNIIFSGNADYSGSTLLVGAVLFAFQIYGDFSGYSDIAIGTARLFGYNLSLNFHYPYFSRDIAEFWRRWHISLSSWFRDYLYIPLGGSRGNVLNQVRNVFIIFIVSGFWHGANWTFIIWGAINALCFLPLFLAGKNRQNTRIIAEGKILPNLKELFSVLVTFTITVLAWVFFRAENVVQALIILKGIFSFTVFTLPSIMPYKLFIFIFLLTIIEWVGREKKFPLEQLEKYVSKPKRWVFYYLLLVLIFSTGNSDQDFIYFQF